MELGKEKESDLSLFTDYYEFSMAQGYWKLGMASRRAFFYLHFRELPFLGGYAVSAGQAELQHYLSRHCFGSSSLDFLSSLRHDNGESRFEEGFLRHLENLRFGCQITSVEEGRLVFPHAPVLCVEGPILECQLLEGLALNIIGFQSLIATKAARICAVASPQPVMELGLRRAHGLQAACWASRASYIGGIAATSNVLAGKMYDIPLSGTHAHSWVMSFDKEEQAFESYVSCLPEGCVLLVDTYDTLRGIARAIQVGLKMRNEGKTLYALRIDSGDLTYLSQQARQLLDQAGLNEVKVIASGDLNEDLIDSLRQQGAKIDAWGVGTHLSTAFNQPALGATYKLAAIQDKEGRYVPKMKISSSLMKASVPGRLDLARFTKEDGTLFADMIFDRDHAPEKKRYQIINPINPVQRKTILDKELQREQLLKPLPYASSAVVAPQEALKKARKRCREELTRLHPSICRLTNPHPYPVGLEQGLYQRRMEIINEL